MGSDRPFSGQTVGKGRSRGRREQWSGLGLECKQARSKDGLQVRNQSLGSER